ncbi:hypothetical protein APS67_006005 [Streptomyces sp. AVP053U2]|nr:hypothetical protein APS67_006005 [Streptomyces sp. AVP053U2]
MPYNLPHNLLYSLPFNLPYNLPPGCALDTETCTSVRRSRGLERADYFSTRPPRALRTSAKSHRRTTGTRKPAEARRKRDGTGEQQDGRSEGEKSSEQREQADRQRRARRRGRRAQEPKRQRSSRSTQRRRDTDRPRSTEPDRKNGSGKTRRTVSTRQSRDRIERGGELSRSRRGRRNASGPAQRTLSGARIREAGRERRKGARRARLGGCPEHPPCGRPAAGADAFRRVESQCSRSHERGGGLRVATRCAGKQLRDLAVGHQGSLRGATVRAVTGNGARAELRWRGSRARAKHPWRS